MHVDDLLRTMVERDASDLHLKAGSPPGIRIDGSLVPIAEHKLGADQSEALVRQLLSEDLFARFAEEGDLDTSYFIPDLSRFRVNVFTQRGSVGMVIRRIPENIPALRDLGLPRACRALSERPRGLVLVTGPTGSGKSTTLAAMVDHVNRRLSGHIVTMEDPIEFIHKDKKCWVTQRQIGSDTKSFGAALRRALRQDPDVILVGEMRDLETISLAVTAAETGHLVFGTLHTTSAIQTVNRIIDVFPPEQQQQIRTQLADTLQGIVCQTLLPKTGGRGRVVAAEVLVRTDGIAALMRENKTNQIANLMQTGSNLGMQTLETSLNALLAQELITPEIALSKANSPSLIRVPPKPAR
ncbi:MAG: type IV pilus twitching motility protein PilT [Planctomycetota bacterium]|nr:type IV pilus twitching motility protein PilT [Planctomycetota bacterium]